MESSEVADSISRRVQAGESPSQVLRSLIASTPGMTKTGILRELRTAFPEAGFAILPLTWQWRESERSQMWDAQFDYQLIATLLDSGSSLPWTQEECTRELSKLRPSIDSALEKEQQEALEKISYASLLAKAEALPGKIACIEALWDGDTNGWFLVMSAITVDSDAWSSHFLGLIKYGGDIRLFNGQVPPWPEATHANEVARPLAKHFGAEFYFPSPDKPDDRYPTWLERRGTIAP